jgi:hypothetical protein
MTVFSGLSRPLKLAGLLLVVVALVAAGVGTVTLLSSGGSNTAAPRTSAPSSPGGGTPPPPSSGAPSASPSAPSASPSPSGSPSASASPSGPAAPAPTATTAPGSAPTQGGQPGGANASVKWVVVRVLNNSTIRGLAARAADDFRAQGWNVVEVSNYSAGIIPVTTAYYRPGTDEETAAKALAAEFGMRAEPRFEGIQQAAPGVIVIVTNNYQGLSGKSGS